MTHARQTGFTLFELVVVVIIVGIMATAAATLLNRDSSAGARTEAQRLALLVKDMRQQAILEGTVYAIQFGTDTYQFLRLDQKGELVQAKDDELLHPRRLPAGIHLEVVGTKKDSDSGSDSHPGFVVTPAGEIPPFEVIFDENGHRWRVRGKPPGDVLAEAADGS